MALGPTYRPLKLQMVQFLTHPVGPFTIHFWCPLAKWDIVIANFMDFKSQ